LHTDITRAPSRVSSYEQYAWPAALGAAFRRNSATTALLLAALLIDVMLAGAFVLDGEALRDPGTAADFYAVVPHGVMVGLFGGVGLFVLVALAIGVGRCWRDLQSTAPPATHAAASGAGGTALRDVLTLRHLHVSGQDCVTAPEVRTPWRRRFHHATFYGFALCFASTCVAALYHLNGSPAPYGYTSLPVLLGTAGGIGLLVGPAGLLLQHRDPALSDATERGLDRAFLVLLLLTAATGLALLMLRHHAAMGVLLIVHLGVVLALFLTLPYGKFVHGLYRAAALLKYRRESVSRGA